MVRISRNTLIAACSHTLATERYQTWPSVSQGCVDIQIAGSMNVIRREAVLPSAGQVWPRPWKIPEQLKMIPDAAKLSDTRRRKCVAISTTSGSCVKNRTSHSGQNWQSTVSPIIKAMLIVEALRKV